jgi:16S rRNA (cytosine967-C5)-methyltransferase
MLCWDPKNVSAVSPARKAAFEVLKKVHTGGYASDVLRFETQRLEPRDAGLAGAIVFGCLRFQAQLDYLIDHFSGRIQNKLDSGVLIALRMGIFQIRHLDRIPPHAAVAESVELVKLSGKRNAAGFANAVLRKVHKRTVQWPDKATALSVPAWMLERWERVYGVAEAEGIAKAALEEPESYMNDATGRLQDIGAQSIVPLLGVEPGMKVLDLCAAPGNKTAQILADLRDRGMVVAADRYGKRLVSVTDKAKRVVLDAAEPLPFARPGGRGLFDRILVDAPCSGTGTLARNPEIKWRLQPEDLAAFEDRQRRILAEALAHVAPGGKVVYATCSLEPEENETVVRGMNVEESWTRLPGREEGDGFFAALIAV